MNEWKQAKEQLTETWGNQGQSLQDWGISKNKDATASPHNWKKLVG